MDTFTNHIYSILERLKRNLEGKGNTFFVILKVGQEKHLPDWKSNSNVNQRIAKLINLILRGKRKQNSARSDVGCTVNTSQEYIGIPFFFFVVD